MNNTKNDQHISVLDGWRAISILLVLATHLLPLGPKGWQLNVSAGAMGMALFFTLSGFLITNFLIKYEDVKIFLIRRFFRIIPLAWLGLLIALPMEGVDVQTWIWNFTFLANLPPIHLSKVASHYWSLCVEVQFYVLIAFIFLIFRRRGLYILPLLCLAVTFHRVSEQAYMNIVTWRRADEILAGCVLAMTVNGMFGNSLGAIFCRIRVVSMPALVLALAISSHPDSGWVNYFRPYIASALIGASLYIEPSKFRSLLEAKSFAYIAKISFALYVVHEIVVHSPLGVADDKIVKYIKRVAVIGISFVAAHLSTYYYEEYFIRLGRKISDALEVEKNRKVGQIE